MRVLMTGGGTGGHVNPAIAIANTIRNNIPGSVIEFVGTTRGIENKLVPAAGYKLHHVEIQGLRRSLSLSNIKTAYLTLTSPKKAKRLIEEFRPDVVIGTGGYVCWPVIKAASQMGIPTALHESNAVPGVAVRMLAGCVDRIYLNFAETGDQLGCPEKLMRVGNPLMSSFGKLPRDAARRKAGVPDKYKYFLLSFGGSMGAEMVNEAALSLMRDFTAGNDEVYHFHATGAIEYEAATEKFRKMGLDKFENLKIAEYIYDMPVQMSAADLVISRAGSMSVSEMALSGKCVVFIPSPNVTDNHQFKNANILASAGAAELIEEKNLASGALTETVRHLLSPAGERDMIRMREKIGEFAVPDSTRLIFEDVVRLISEKKGGSKNC